MDLMDAMAVPVGNFRLSVLLVLKGAVTLAAFVWIANATVASGRTAGAACSRRSTPAMQVLAAKLVRMTLLTLAVVLALGSIGIDLTAFAVFSGAVGVGVGFGLQKVVSNLVSGVILLLDRSIKPGDVIEIDGTYGSVSALNARYASVLTRDGKEYLIPNEDLITQRVTNWSFSNDLIRLHVKVGISYRSDPHEAIRLALEAARDVPRVLADLRPTACWSVRRQHDRSGAALLDQRSGERHSERAQRGDAEHVGSLSAARHRNAPPAARHDAAQSRGAGGRWRPSGGEDATLSRRADQRN